jgi:type I restriction enzyme S subunit
MSDVTDSMLPELPDDWRWVPIAQLTAPEPRALTDGPFGSNLRTEHYTESGPRVIRLQNIGDGAFLDAKAHISEERFEFLRGHEARSGDIVLASLGESLPRACLVPDWLGPAIVKADCPRLRPHPDLNAAYLVFALNSDVVRQQAAAVMHGVGRPRLKLAELRKLLIPVPPRPEQDLIVRRLKSLLGELGNGVEEFQRALAGLGRYRHACLAAAFDGATRRLEEVASLQSGITKGRPRGDDLIEMPYIRTANVQALRLDLGEIKTLLVTPQQRDKHLLRDEDVLVLEGGDADKVGRGWIWSGEVKNCLHQNHVFVVRPDRDVMFPRFLAYYLNAPPARRYFLSVAKQSVNLASINQSDLKNLPVPLPLLGEQRDRVATLDRQLSATAEMEAGLRARLGETALLRRSLIRAGVEGQLTQAADGGSTGDTALRTREECPQREGDDETVRRKRRAVLIGEYA